MTYSELLNSVSFDEIMPYIEKYHGHAKCTALYKTHYDMLRMLTPHREEGDNATATISNAEVDYTWEEPHLDGYPLEGDLWEVSLAKELIIEPDVDATPAEIAMCCLWHTSFYGFTREGRHETFEKLDYYASNLLDTDIIKDKAARITRLVEEAGGKLPKRNEMLSIPSFRKEFKENMAKHKQRLKVLKELPTKNRRYKRRFITNHYRKRMVSIGTFVEACLPVQNNGISIADLCELFYTNHYKYYEYQSYTGNYQERTSWMMELIEKYDAFRDGTLANVMVCIAVAPEYPFSESEHALLNQIASLCPGKMTYMIKTDEQLGQELKMTVAFCE